MNDEICIENQRNSVRTKRVCLNEVRSVYCISCAILREREEEAGRTYITDLHLAVSARSRVRDSDKIDLVERQTLKYVSRTYVQIVYTQPYKFNTTPTTANYLSTPSSSRS